MHSDFQFQNSLKLWRRINVLLYLNSDWEDSWGGHLHLWDRYNSSEPKISYAPIHNNMVIFKTTNNSFHGHPGPLMSPEHIQRKSVAVYYYTSDINPGQEILESSTNFVDTPDMLF
jgi:Rps23 Pro-64 3,4-dihydroxylase Tpa1-like proline 4-hydroxylase